MQSRASVDDFKGQFDWQKLDERDVSNCRGRRIVVTDQSKTFNTHVKDIFMVRVSFLYARRCRVNTRTFSNKERHQQPQNISSVLTTPLLIEVNTVNAFLNCY